MCVPNMVESKQANGLVSQPLPFINKELDLLMANTTVVCVVLQTIPYILHLHVLCNQSFCALLSNSTNHTCRKVEFEGF